MAKLSYTAAEIDALLEKIQNIENYYTRDPSATITANSDLNDYKTPGRFGCNTGSVAATILNAPYSTSGYRLEVVETTGNNLMQKLYPNAQNLANGAVYMRTYTASSGTWSEWYTFGASGGGATIGTLWSDSSGATVGTEYTMTGDVNGYDVVYLKCGNSDDITTNNDYVQTSFMPALIGQNENLSVECFYFKRYLRVAFANNKFTVLNSAATDESRNVKPTIFSIIGIKY